MIVVTFKGSPSPLLGYVRGLNIVADLPGPSVVAALAHAANRFRNETEGFLFVAPGARIHSARIWPVFRQTNWDVAAFVDCIGNLPKSPRVFSGVGRVSLETLLVRPSAAGRRLLARWTERVAATGGDEAVQLAIALVETRTVFLQLPRAWVWREAQSRAIEPMADPVVELGNNLPVVSRKKLPEKLEQPPIYTPKGPELVVVSHLYQWTGFGNMARQILFRVSNTVKVKIDDTHKEPCYVDRDLQCRLDAYKGAIVGPRAPLLRMMGPDHIASKERHRLLWAMQETSKRVHPDMVERINENFDELIVPTSWGLGVFRDSGVRLPGCVIPLGVNPLIYRPLRKKPLPKCRLISTSRRGLFASPDGFIFLTVGLPGRKGWDVIADAFEQAFLRKRDVHFVIGLTHSPPAWNQKIYKQFSKYKVPIWTIEGSFSDHEMAEIYNSSDCYVSASSGEGFGLTPAESAACGLPVIVPNNTSHTEIFGLEAFLFDGDGERVRPEWDTISDWYKGMLFTYFGKKAVGRLADLMKFVKEGGAEVRSRTNALRKKITEQYTWDRSAEAITKRILEAQP